MGVTSSGKSTLGMAISNKLGVPFIESDALLWAPKWQKAADYVQKMTIATAASAWVMAGNTSEVRQLVLTQANVVVWLDYPFWTVLWQLVRRSVSRWWTQELLWGTNYESLWVHLKLWSKDSLVHWLFKTYWNRKREYPLLFQQFPHLVVHHFTHPTQTQAWLDSLPSTTQQHPHVE
ncbi:hypothetical protein DYB37_004910 [Aphanomyces astaci]|uniref:Adenylate kinase n=1 Tax=Aphanomyces astaci TaxID=112090 RepID=A0A397G1F9_APHAT|nr:hypothetical protein DYB25_002630 [Aphanomyces astaci]RHY56902.1 hypothetical protein DYB34_001224 [Aphanomyces astaci]RHY57710.1 hypothetical protein DYB30_000766 [Aphanomyces astaci]RHY90051.1 hypothetical protein DYB35_001616 [Aphanomyces astaci]RHZ20741.1 hypothetical protein DYB37_004910 [Aphanomyces astaci]